MISPIQQVIFFLLRNFKSFWKKVKKCTYFDNLNLYDIFSVCFEIFKNYLQFLLISQMPHLDFFQQVWIFKK